MRQLGFLYAVVFYNETKETQISITAVTNVYWMTVFQNYIHRHVEMSE